MSEKVIPILLPKWGMDMDEGKIGEWLVSVGEPITEDTDVLEIESDKVTNVLNVSRSGTLRLKLVNAGETHPVGTLLGVIVDGDVSDDEISNFVADYKSATPVIETQDQPEISQIDQMVEVNGQKLHYISVGDGDETVVLIHGFGGDLSSWGGLPMALAQTYRVIGVELPGHGLSSKRVEAVGSKDFAELLLAFLDKLETGNVHLIGHSLGGTIGAQMASNAPMRVKSLTLVSNYGLGTKVDLDFLEEFVSASRRKGVKAVLKRLFANAGVVNSEMIENILKLKRLEGVEQALRIIADKIGEEQPEISAVMTPPVPTQVIIGRADEIIVFDEALFTDVEHISIIDDAGHMPQLEKPAQTETLIKDFLGKSQEYQSL